jgi:hypothetical protein
MQPSSPGGARADRNFCSAIRRLDANPSDQPTVQSSLVNRFGVLEFDVAEDMTRFTFDQTKVFEDGLPAHGSSFITEG